MWSKELFESLTFLLGHLYQRSVGGVVTRCICDEYIGDRLSLKHFCKIAIVGVRGERP